MIGFDNTNPPPTPKCKPPKVKVREPSLSDQLGEWREELDLIKVRLAGIGERGDSLEYNILSASALRLMECIADLSYIEGWKDCAKSGGANE